MGISLKYFLLKIQVRTMKFAAVIVVFALVASAYADVYMHNPRGGNNRVDDANNAPANRLFDSQNNNQAGYNSGEYHFMSVKNNAYSNRSQKGTIIVEDGVASTATTL